MSSMCKRCYKLLHTTEGIKCANCESRYHTKCAGDSKTFLESGDKKYQWTCATCKRPTDKSFSSTKQHDLLVAINAVSEKMELVNKIQLPKLNNDLNQIKLTAEKIQKQNESILKQFEQMKKKSEQCHNFQCRHFNISPRMKVAEEKPILGDNLQRHRTRRHSYTLVKILLHLNRLRRNKIPRQ